MYRFAAPKPNPASQRAHAAQQALTHARRALPAPIAQAVCDELRWGIANPALGDHTRQDELVAAVLALPLEEAAS